MEKKQKKKNSRSYIESVEFYPAETKENESGAKDSWSAFMLAAAKDYFNAKGKTALPCNEDVVSDDSSESVDL